MFRGLFIGVDQYLPPVQRLSCAGRDARALHALFSDSLGGDTTLLIDDEATRTGIVTELEHLADCAPTDLVLVTFSGHGTPDHRLVPVDLDHQDPTSMVDLEELAGLLDRVSAKQLFVVLDCCFSGGFGGERSFATTQTRSMEEDTSKLISLGHGRVVLTACSAGEYAHETSQLGHGLLTNRLLEALQGPPGLSSPRLGMHELLGYIVRSVMDDALAIAATQTPTVYSSIEGEATLPRLEPGERWYELFPEHARPPASHEWSSLAPYGLPGPILEQWAEQMPELNDLQLAAINDHGVLDGRNVVVVAPTSSGKTLIGEMAAVQAAARGGRSIFLLPLKALVNDKYEAFTATYGADVGVVRATGDHSDQIDLLLGGHYDVALLTYEKFAALVLGHPHLMRGVDTVIVDEAQMITDRGRGANLEFALTLLRRGHGSTAPSQVVALSAVTGDTAGLERWLNASLLWTDVRPVPLTESVIDPSGARLTIDADGQVSAEPGFVTPEYYGGSATSKPFMIGLVRRLVAENKKVIVFRNWKGKTVGTARYLADALGLDAASDALDALPNADPAIASETLRAVLARGVAFHNADLDPTERAVIEAEFRDRKSNLRVIVATTTLAMGINTPAEAVVIEGLDHGSNSPYSVAEYKNMVGRAGRLGQVDAGEAYLMATDELAPHHAIGHYVSGELEPIESRLMEAGTDPQTILLRTLSALGGTGTESDIIGLVESSFAAWQLRTGHPATAAWEPASLVRDLDELLAAGLVDHDVGDELVLTDLGRYAGVSGTEVVSLVRLALVVDRCGPRLHANDLLALAQITTELDQVRLRTHRKSIRERSRWLGFLSASGVNRAIIDSLHIGGELAVVRAKRAAAAMYFASATGLATAERELMQHVQDNSASGPIRSVASRTRDVLDAVATVASARAGIDCGDVADELSIRLEFGVPGEMVELARHFGAVLTRGEYLALHSAGIHSVDAIRRIDNHELDRLVGSRTSNVARQALAR